MKKKICIITFSNISRDGRVLRQIKYLSQDYQIKVIGYGLPHPSWKDLPVEFHPIEPYQPSLFTRMADFIYLGLAQIFPAFYQKWYWRRLTRQKALKIALTDRCDAFHANDWNTLPIAAMASEKFGTKLVFDAHEYAPLESENLWYWPLQKSGIDWVLHSFVPKVNLSTTVVEAIASKYREEFGLNPQVILNAPEIEELIPTKKHNEKINLVYHGAAGADRGLEKMIKTVALCDGRFLLNFMLTNLSPSYLNRLENMANEIAPGKVIFHSPVTPENVVLKVAEFDIGLILLEPNSFNNYVALPNKLFEYLVSGLAICSGPSVSIAQVVTENQLGVISKSFEPVDMAIALNGLDQHTINKMQQASMIARHLYNAKIEMGKLLNLYKNLFASQD